MTDNFEENDEVIELTNKLSDIIKKKLLNDSEIKIATAHAKEAEAKAEYAILEVKKQQTLQTDKDVKKPSFTDNLNKFRNSFIKPEQDMELEEPEQEIEEQELEEPELEEQELKEPEEPELENPDSTNLEKKTEQTEDPFVLSSEELDEELKRSEDDKDNPILITTEKTDKPKLEQTIQDNQIQTSNKPDNLLDLNDDEAGEDKIEGWSVGDSNSEIDQTETPEANQNDIQPEPVPDQPEILPETETNQPKIQPEPVQKTLGGMYEIVDENKLQEAISQVTVGGKKLNNTKRKKQKKRNTKYVKRHKKNHKTKGNKRNKHKSSLKLAELIARM